MLDTGSAVEEARAVLEATGGSTLGAAIRARLTYANVAATLALILALGGGAFAATSFVGPKGQIRACVGKKGKLTLAKAGKGCGKGKRAVVWNQKGVAGPRGVAGPPGSPGSPGRGIEGSEAWHEVGHPGEPAFVTGVSCNGGHPCHWANSSDSAFGITNEVAPTTTAFYRDPLGVVHLKGAPCVVDLLTSDCESGTSVPFGGTPIYTLPAGYRPERDWNYTVPGSGPNELARISVHSDGTVNVVSPNSVIWAALDGITFRVAG
jgi:hypothetical protein